MKKDQPFKVRLDETGRVLLPPEFQRSLDWSPAARSGWRLTAHGLNIQPSVHRLAKVYIEPTNAMQSGLCHLHAQRLG